MEFFSNGYWPSSVLTYVVNKLFIHKMHLYYQIIRHFQKLGATYEAAETHLLN